MEGTLVSFYFLIGIVCIVAIVVLGFIVCLFHWRMRQFCIKCCDRDSRYITDYHENLYRTKIAAQPDSHSRGAAPRV